MPFQFKHFSIQQESTAMKVGTDGVLLGAWSKLSGNNMLDIGTGTGLIAIMLAQRTERATIDAIELEYEAYREALQNTANCDWSDRIEVCNCSIQDYYPQKKYDTIVSNPPFFVDSTKTPNAQRNSARHADNLSFNDLITAIIRLLKPDGIFSLILPTTEAKHFIELAEKQQLFLNSVCTVKPNPIKTAKRVLMEFSFHKKEITTKELTIETKTIHQYTKEYISLTKDFYLKF